MSIDPKLSLAYAKLVATPTNTSWSQVYNAGNLFACLSLTAPENTEESTSLHALGKDVFSILESEFFTLEDKNLITVKEAITTSLTHVPASVTVNLSLALFKDTILYVFIAGGGKILMKRGDNVGILLEQSDQGKKIITASGLLKNNDLIILGTTQFSGDISTSDLTSALELSLPSDIAEVLSPHIHEKDDGGQAAIIIAYHGFTPDRNEEHQTLADAVAVAAEDAKETITEIDEDQVASIHTPEEESLTQQEGHKRRSIPHISLPRPSFLHLSHKKRLFLNIAIILVVILAMSIAYAIKKDKQTKEHALFISIYDPAKKAYEEGKALETLNKTLSHEDFLKAQQLLKGQQGTFTKGSDEEKLTRELLAKIDVELGIGRASVSPITAIAATPDASFLLNLEKAMPDGLAFGNDGTIGYVATMKTIQKVNLETNKKLDVVTNDKDWQKPVSLLPYQGNIYLLDQEKGLLKYTASGTGYTKSFYFKNSPDLSKAVSMSIDGSVWLLFGDGAIMKYTRGESDGFKIKGLDKSLTKPTKLFTNVDIDNIYVLDRGNARIVKITKDGTFQAEYKDGIFKQADDFDVSESDKKIFILSKGKIYEVKMK